MNSLALAHGGLPLQLAAVAPGPSACGRAAAPRRAKVAQVSRRARGGQCQASDRIFGGDRTPFIGSLTSVAIASAAAVGWFRGEHDRLGPKAYLRGKQNKLGTARPVVCLGDGIVRGSVCRDWVGQLSRRLGNIPVVNAGINMDGARDLCRRLGEVLECQPRRVVVLVGTTDIKAELSELEGWVYSMVSGRSERPDLERFEVALLELKGRLLEAGAEVAFVSPPVLGEDPWSSENRRAAVYAATVRRVAEEGGCTYLPLFEKSFAKLPLEGGTPYDGARSLSWMVSAALDAGDRRDFQEVQRERGLTATVDLVHPGDEVARALEEMVAAFARGGCEAPGGTPRPEAEGLLQQAAEGRSSGREPRRSEAAQDTAELTPAVPRGRAQRASARPRSGGSHPALGQQKLVVQGIVRTLKKLAEAGRGLLPVAELGAEFEALWKVPFPLEKRGEHDLVDFLQAWPRKVQVVDCEGTPCVRLADEHDRLSRLAKRAAREAQLR